MVYFDTVGENDFASIFQSVALENKEAAERRQLENMIEILDRMSEEEEARAEQEMYERRRRPRKMVYDRDGFPVGPMDNVEFYKVIDEDGFIRERDDNSNGLVVHNRSKVYTLDDLPRESEWEQVFGPAPEDNTPPMVNVKAGLRLRDGEKSYVADFMGDSATAEWKGARFNTLIVFLLSGILLILLFTRIGKREARREQKVFHAKPEPPRQSVDLRKVVYDHVDRRIHERYSLNASHFV